MKLSKIAMLLIGAVIAQSVVAALPRESRVPGGVEAG